MAKTPGVRPVIPHFSSGPCAKRPGWSLQALIDAVLGRSHRSKIGRAKLKRAIDLSREVLEAPADYRFGIVPASDTGAVEMALWSLLGPRPVTMLAWESFGEGWVGDVLKVGDEVSLRVEAIDVPGRRLSLTRLDARGAVLGSDDAVESDVIENVLAKPGDEGLKTNLGSLFKKALEKRGN